MPSACGSWICQSRRKRFLERCGIATRKMMRARARWFRESFERVAGSGQSVGRKTFGDVAMIRLIVVFVLVWLAPGFAAAQSLKEIRVGSSNISVTNVVAYYARD